MLRGFAAHSLLTCIWPEITFISKQQADVDLLWQSTVTTKLPQVNWPPSLVGPDITFTPTPTRDATEALPPISARTSGPRSPSPRRFCANSTATGR